MVHIGVVCIRSVLLSNANGNRESDLTVSGSISYDAQDRLEQYGSTLYSYTARGTLSSKDAAGQETTYDYDVFGNLRKATVVPQNVVRREM